MDWGNFCVGEHIDVLGNGHARRGHGNSALTPSLPQYVVPCISPIWLSPSGVL